MTTATLSTIKDKCVKKYQPYWGEKGASQVLEARQMLGTPQGANWHIKHNITSCTGVQSLLPSGELLHYVLLPQFKSQELETNAPQTGLAHDKSTLGSSVQKAKTVYCSLSSCIQYLRGDKDQIFLCKLAAVSAFFQ